MMLVKFRQVEFRELFYNRDFRAVGEIDINVSMLAEKFGVFFADTDEFSEGTTKIGYFVSENETPFFIEEFPSKYRKPRTQIGLLYAKETLTDELEDVLESLELTSKNLTWFDKNIKLYPHELWRQDDNGHQFLIETFPCKADAVRAMKEFEARLHKQTYWVQKVYLAHQLFFSDINKSK